MNESWDKADSQAIRLAEVAVMLMMTICCQNCIPTFIVLCHHLENQTKFCVLYTKTFIHDLPFLPNLLRTYNVLAMYLIIIIIIIKVSYLIAQGQCLTNWGDWFIHGHVLIRVLYTKLMYKSESKNCCVNKSLILIVQTCTFRFLTLWLVHFHPEDSAQ